jgi:hypothetical protein
MEINQQKIEEAIVEQAVDKFIRNDDIYSRVTKGINARIDKVFSDKVDALLTATIDKIVTEGFDRSYHKIDAFGRPSGAATTIRKELEALISGYWEAKVGRDGKPVANGYDTVSRAEWLMTQLCADDFNKEMKQHVVNVGGALKDHFRATLNEHIGIMLSDVFRVNSAGDQALRNQGGIAIIHPKTGD